MLPSSRQTQQEQVATARWEPLGGLERGQGKGTGAQCSELRPGEPRSQAAQAKQGLRQRQCPGLMATFRPPVPLPAYEGPEMGHEEAPCPSHHRA